jgi:hypothetical protein
MFYHNRYVGLCNVTYLSTNACSSHVIRSSLIRKILDEIDTKFEVVYFNGSICRADSSFPAIIEWQ